MFAIGLDFEARRVAELDLPEPDAPGPGQLRLRVLEVGLCGTDRELSEFEIGEPPPGEHALTLGHEALAEVVEAGPRTKLQPGDLVAPLVRRPCLPGCAACRRLRRDLCLSGGYTERGILGLHGYLREWVVDDESDLVAVPADLASIAVLAEPLSVVEKGLTTAERVHPLGPARALIFGAGPVGLLAALACVARGWEVEVFSLEPPNHPNAELARRGGARYSNETPSAKADVVLECSGAPAAARQGLDWLAPLGVMVLIGAADFDVRFPGFRTVMENQTVTGVVNASPEHFATAVSDLARFDRGVLQAMIHRRALKDWRAALGGEGAEAPKSVLAVAG
ncbi:MAG: alcohol dehydrogenase catalytic domain-containing protein [Bryobacteraceae bacterium]|nr:alcohol dehydrogenase catalytic domain-containing protein [Bryobacteraceae bacterium]